MSTESEKAKWLGGIQSSSNNNTEENKKQIQLQSERFAIFRGKPFCFENIEEHKAEDIKTKGACCFNHIIGLRHKDEIEKAYF